MATFIGLVWTLLVRKKFQIDSEKVGIFKKPVKHQTEVDYFNFDTSHCVNTTNRHTQSSISSL